MYDIAVDAFLSTYAVSISVDLGRTLVESALNFMKDERTLSTLSPKECAFVIPCHNSADVINETLNSLPDYPIYCVANACTDNTEDIISSHERATLISTVEPGKIRAVLLGAQRAKQAGYTHFILVDDDVLWPTNAAGDHLEIGVYDKGTSCTALPVLPDLKRERSWMTQSQFVEYAMMVISKRSQALLGNVIMASGAAGIFNIDNFLTSMTKHDGEHVGDDLQTSFIFHTLGFKIDFNSALTIKTHVPKNLKTWWSQRVKRWEPSPIFNFIWHLNIIFSPLGVGPGWWIRCIAYYRILVVKLDMIRFFTLPFVLLSRPTLFLGVLAISYLSILCKVLVFKRFFEYKSLNILTLLSYPVYGALCWFSRVWSLPRGLKLLFRYWILQKRKTLIEG